MNVPSPVPGLQRQVDAALADAARRTGVPVSGLKLLRAERVTWSDGSLGCPAPGMMYTQALVPGFRIRIEAAGQVLDYHGSVRGGVAQYCPPGRAVEPRGADDRI